jgi:hypothetical protein
MLNLESPKTIQECLNIQSHFVGIPKITKKNCNEFHRRGKMLQVLGVGVLVKEDTTYMKRMLYLDEIENNMNFTTANVRKLNQSEWKKEINNFLDERIKQLIKIDKKNSDTSKKK